MVGFVHVCMREKEWERTFQWTSSTSISLAQMGTKNVKCNVSLFNNSYSGWNKITFIALVFYIYSFWHLERILASKFYWNMKPSIYGMGYEWGLSLMCFIPRKNNFVDQMMKEIVILVNIISVFQTFVLYTWCFSNK